MVISLSTLRVFDKFISALAAVGRRMEVARRWFWARRAVRLALWGSEQGPGTRMGKPAHGRAPGGWGTHRRAAFSSPSWIAGRFECFLRMRHLPKVGE